MSNISTQATAYDLSQAQQNNLLEFHNRVRRVSPVTDESTMDRLYDIRGDMSYAEVLEIVQKYMAEISGFNVDEMSADDIARYKKHMDTCIREKKLTCRNVKTLSELLERLYNSMARYDVLTEYLKPEIYNEMGIEEIYGRWNCIYIIAKNKKMRLKECFPSLERCENIMAKIARTFDKNVNNGTPTALGELAPMIRASIVASPITSPESGPEFNIRIVHGSKMKRKLLLGGGTIDEYGLNFLELCIRHKVNICIGGATGSGKTGTMNYLLQDVTKDDTYRVGTLEIESREFNLMRYDDEGNCINDVFSWVTRQSDDARYNISAYDLLEKFLRFHADIFGIGEMRNREALATCEAALTGHGVITSIHSEDATETPGRIVTLCKKSGINYDDKTLYDLATKAFPIIVYQMQNKQTGKRIIMEIAEVVGYKDEKVVMNPIMAYEIADNEEKNGIEIGRFTHHNPVTDKLRKRFINNGCSKEALRPYCGGELC